MANPERPIALVGSSGGHLAHLLLLKNWWSDRSRFWVTFNTPDAVSALEGERVYWCFHPTNRSAVNFFRNLFLAFQVCLRERPRLIVSSGAAVAVPFFYVGKMFGARTIYLEVVDRIDTPTLTARLVRPVTDVFAVQWPRQLELYPRSQLIGRLM
jgi:UDP-N-acetylglucosamine:LPS N-acetylglucosamine transferase